MRKQTRTATRYGKIKNGQFFIYNGSLYKKERIFQDGKYLFYAVNVITGKAYGLIDSYDKVTFITQLKLKQALYTNLIEKYL